MDEPKTSLRRSTPLVPVLAVLATVAAAAVAVILLRRPDAAPAQRPPEARPATDAAPSQPAPEPAESDPAEVARALEPASFPPLLRPAVEDRDALAGRAAAAIANLAEGSSPRKQLAWLGPDRPFAVVERGGRTVIAPAAFARYDAVGDAIAAVDVETLARAYRAVRAPLQAAYRALGYPGASIDAVLARALRRLEDAPRPDGELAVVDEGGVYVFEDPRLEHLPEVEKHLLRMGARNGGIVRDRARALREALDLPAVPAVPGARSGDR